MVLHQRKELDEVAAGMKRYSFLMLGTCGVLLAIAVFVSFLSLLSRRFTFLRYNVFVDSMLC